MNKKKLLTKVLSACAFDGMLRVHIYEVNIIIPVRKRFCVAFNIYCYDQTGIRPTVVQYKSKGL